MPRALVVSLFVLLASCELPTEILVADYRLLEAPEVYREWYREVGACAGEQDTGELFHRVRWYTAEVVHYRGEHWKAVGGVWIEPHDIILRADRIERERTVKHEALHHLLQVEGHPPVFDRCGLR